MQDCELSSSFRPFHCGLAHEVPCTGSGSEDFFFLRGLATAFVQGVRNGNPSELGTILGPGTEQIVSSSDSVANKAARESFLKRYDERHSLVPARQGEFTLEVGEDAWPLPIPLAHSNGKWYWDEKQANRNSLSTIGHNELAAINVCKGIVAAQHDYVASAHDGQPAGSYAARMLSEPGKQNGLYWEVKEGQPESPAGPMIGQAARKAMTAGKRTPYHGYYYRVLPAAGGFGLVAFPADYRSAGVITFLVNQKGVIYQKDLGDNTARIAKRMASYGRDKT